MTQYLSQESLALLLWCAFLLGLLLGAVYSLFAIRRAAFLRLHIPRVVSALFLHLEDFLLCTMAGVLLSVLYFATVSGVLRLMALPALIIGLILWRLTAGRLIAACTDRILHLLAVLCRWILRRILAPIGRALRRAFSRLCRYAAMRRERRFRRRLARRAKRITLRYRAALLAAAEQGTLPPPDLPGSVASVKKSNKPKERVK